MTKSQDEIWQSKNNKNKTKITNTVNAYTNTEVFHTQSKKHKYYKRIHQYEHGNQKSTSTVNAYTNTKAFPTQLPTIWLHTDTDTLTPTPTHAHTHPLYWTEKLCIVRKRGGQNQTGGPQCVKWAVYREQRAMDPTLIPEGPQSPGVVGWMRCCLHYNNLNNLSKMYEYSHWRAELDSKSRMQSL